MCPSLLSIAELANIADFVGPLEPAAVLGIAPPSPPAAASWFSVYHVIKNAGPGPTQPSAEAAQQRLSKLLQAAAKEHGLTVSSADTAADTARA